MTNAAIRRKSDARNPHARFEEMSVASAATPRRGSLPCIIASCQTAMRAIIAVCAVFLLSLSCAADQWWVGGASGDWSGNNWASEKGGTGAAWTSGGTGWFTLSPVTIDLKGVSQSVSCFKTTGFTADNPCRIAIKNTSSTKPTISFSGLNKASVDDFANAVVEFGNVSVTDTEHIPLRLANGSHFHLNDGSTFKKSGNSSANDAIFVGYDSATSNSLYVAKGSTLEFKKDLYIGCGTDKTVAPTGVVYVAGTLKLDWFIYMGRRWDTHYSGCAGRSVLIVDGGTVETVDNGQLQVGAMYVANDQYNQTSEIVVRNGGLLKIKSDLVRLEWSDKQSIVVDGGTLSVGGSFWCRNPWQEPSYCVRNATTTVKNGGVLEVGGTFAPNQKSWGNDAYLFDGGTFRVIKNGIAAWGEEEGTPDFTVGEGGMAMDTPQNMTNIWYMTINKGVGKITKIGSGTMKLAHTSSNAGGWDVKEGVLWLVPDTGKKLNTRVNGESLTVLNGGTLKNGALNKPTNGLADRIVLTEGATVSASVDTTAQCVFGKDVAIEGPVNVAFDGELAEGVDYPVLAKTGDSAFTDEDAARCRPAAGTAHAGQVRFRRSSDGKTIYARRVKGFIILFR